MTQLKEMIDELRSINPDNRYIERLEEIETEYKRVERERDAWKGQAMKNIIDTSKIREHYRHAVEKHPYFIDTITSDDSDEIETKLQAARYKLEIAEEHHNLTGGVVLMCEWYEIMDAYEMGDYDQATEECYDAIAVLLRLIDVFQGRQTIGRQGTEVLL